MVFNTHFQFSGKKIYENVYIFVVLEGVAPFITFITINEQSESNTDCNFYYSIAYFASGSLYNQNLVVKSTARQRAKTRNAFH